MDEGNFLKDTTEKKMAFLKEAFFPLNVENRRRKFLLQPKNGKGSCWLGGNMKKIGIYILPLFYLYMARGFLRGV
jgi:hypothetical protein